LITWVERGWYGILQHGSFRWLERLAVGHRMDGTSIRIGLKAFEVLVYERT
jgi:hypothetical protein